jgi:NAD(P)H-dependent FMN reductase
MKKIGIIVGSTREGRKSIEVAEWFLKKAQAASPSKISFGIVDLLQFPLPFFGEPDRFGMIQSFEEAIRGYDGFVFVTPEYNHSITGVLKNALDFAYQDWNNKTAGIITYGFGANGARAAEHLRGILGALGVADVKTHILLSLFDDVAEQKIQPRSLHDKNINLMIQELLFRLGETN